eukprot:1487285-Amphidinium_carterae.1
MELSEIPANVPWTLVQRMHRTSVCITQRHDATALPDAWRDVGPSGFFSVPGEHGSAGTHGFDVG